MFENKDIKFENDVMKWVKYIRIGGFVIAAIYGLVSLIGVIGANYYSSHYLRYFNWGSLVGGFIATIIRSLAVAISFYISSLGLEGLGRIVKNTRITAEALSNKKEVE